MRFKHKDGYWATVICRGKPIQWDDDDNPVRFVGVHTDITARLKDEKIASQNAKLASIGQLAAGVGHEINNPLSVISGFLGLIAKKIRTKDPIDPNRLQVDLSV